MEEDGLRQSVVMHSVRNYSLPGPLETPSPRQPGPGSQSGYNHVQQRTLNQWHAPQSLGLSSGQSSPQSNSSSACLQSSPVNRNHPLGPQQTLSYREPGPESQSGGYYSVQQRTLNQWNAPQSLGVSSGQSFTSVPQSNSNSTYLQSSPGNGNHPLGPQQTLSCRETGPESQSGGYYSVQQRTLNQWNAPQSLGLSSGQSFTSSPQSNSSSSCLQSSPGNRNHPLGSQQSGYNGPPLNTLIFKKHNLQGFSNGNSFSLSSQPSSGSANPQVGFTGPQSQLNYRTQASFTAPCPNAAVQLRQLQAAPLRAPAVNINYHAQLPHKNTILQDNKNTTPFQNMNCTSSWFPSNGGSVLENNKVHGAVLQRYLREKHNRMQTLHQSADQPQQTSSNDLVSEASLRFNINQGQMQKVRNGATNSCAPGPPPVTQTSMAPSLPPPYKGSHITVNSYSNHRVPPLNRPPGSFVVQRESEQLINQSSSTSLPQHTQHLKVFEERQTRPAVAVPRHHSKNLPSLPALHSSRGPQDLQSNSMTGVFPRTSPTSGTSPTGEAPCSDFLASALLWKFQKQCEGQSQGPDGSPLFSSSAGLRASATESRDGPVTADHIASMLGDSRTQASVSNSSIPPNSRKIKISMVGPVPTERTVLSDESAHSSSLKGADVEGSQSSRLQDSQTERRGGQMSDEGHREVKHCTEPAECLQLVKELQKAVRQAYRAVAVVPPISQQPDPVQKEDVITTTDDSLPFKIDAVWTLAEMENNASKKLKELFEPPSVPQSQTPESIKPANDSVINAESCKTPSTTPGSLSVDVPQTESGPISKSQSSKASQSPVCVNDLRAETPVQQTNDLNVESCTDDSPFHLSTVPGIDFTLEKLQQLIKSLEATPTEKEKEAITDVIKCILDLYWGGNIRNLADEIQSAKTEWTKMVPEMCVNAKQGVVLQYLAPENLKRLSCHCDVLQEDVPLPRKKFKSSWWNESSPDIDKVLAEPISEYDFTWCKDDSQSVFDVNAVDSLAQLCGNDAGDLVVANQNKESEITPDSIAEQSVISDCPSEPVCSPEVLMPATADHQVDVINQEEHACESKSDPSGSFKKPTSEKQEDIQQDHEPHQQGFLQSDEIRESLTQSTNEIKCNTGHRNAGEEANSPKAKPKDLTDMKTQKDEEEMHPESPVQTSHLSPSDVVEDDGSCESDSSTKNPLPHVIPSVQKDEEKMHPRLSPSLYVEGDGISESDSSTNDPLPPVILLSSDDDDDTLIIEDSDEQDMPTPSCQVDPNLLTVFSLSDNREIWSHGPTSHVKLTCPHVTDITSGTDHFCPKCLTETPLLDLDLDESLFSSKEGGPSSPIKLDEESCNQQPGKLAEGRMTESDLFIPKVNGPEATRDSESPKTGRQSSSPQSSVPPDQELTEPLTEDTKLAKEKVYSIKRSVRAKLTEALPHSEKAKSPQTQTSLLKYLAGKKHRLSKTGAKPADSGQRSRSEKRKFYSPIAKNNSPPTEAHPYSPNACLKPQLSKAIESPSPKKVMRRRLEGTEHSAQSNDGQEREVKNVKFLLFGSQSRDFQPPCHSRQKFLPAPVYINVSASPKTGPKYTGMLSATRKSFNKSCGRFVQKRNISLRKKGQKDCELLLKNRIEIQKKIMRERSVWKALKEKV